MEVCSWVLEGLDVKGEEGCLDESIGSGAAQKESVCIERTLNVRPHRPPMAQRVTLRKRTPYNTTSNRRRVVKTPGGKLVYHHLKKLATAPKCGDCGIALPGVRFGASVRYASDVLTIGVLL